MFPVARMGANVTKSPIKVLETASQVRGYLKKTLKEGLKFAAKEGGRRRSFDSGLLRLVLCPRE